MSPPQPSNPTTADPEKSTAEAPDKVFKTAFVNMLKDLKDDMNKFINELCETQRVE